MTNVSIDGKTIQLPTTWNDLNLHQQITCYAIIMTDTAQVLDPFEILPAKKIALLQYLLQLPSDFFTKREMDFYLEALEEMPINSTAEQQTEYRKEALADAKTIVLSEINQLFTTISFLFEKMETEEGQPEQYAISLTLTKCPYPYIEFKTRTGKARSRRKVRWYAPADGLHNLSLYELGHAFTKIEAYLRTKNEKYINELLAMIYRPSKPKTDYNLASNYEGDRRQPYRKHETTVANRQSRIEKMPQAVKQLLVFWFASCRQQIVKRYPTIFTRGGENTTGNNYGYAALLLNLADGIVHLDTVSDQNFHNAFTFLSYKEDMRKLAEFRNA